MPRLTYPYLGIGTVGVGDPLGCDCTGWPYRIAQVEHDGPRDRTVVELEPWPIPGPADAEDQKRVYLAALEHARDRMAGRVG